MQAQNITETNDVRMSPVSRITLKVAFNQLAEIIQANGIQIDLPITLTQKLQKDLAEIIEQLPVQEEVTNSWRLTVKQDEVDEQL
jgi:ribonuclease D